MKKEIISFLSIVIMIIGNAASKDCYAYDQKKYLAAVCEVEGDVYVTRALSGEEEEAEVDMELFENDEIKVESSSSVKITFSDEHIIEVPENSKIKIAKIDKKTETEKYSVKILFGKLFASIKTLIKGSSFEVAGKSAIASVKGTDFTVEIDENEDGVAVFEGSVDVEAVGETGEKYGKVELTGEQEVIVGRKRAVLAARKLARFIQHKARAQRLKERVKLIRKLKENNELQEIRRVRAIAKAYKLAELKSKYPARFEMLSDAQKTRINEFIRINNPADYEKLKNRVKILKEKHGWAFKNLNERIEKRVLRNKVRQKIKEENDKKRENREKREKRENKENKEKEKRSNKPPRGPR